MFYVNRISLTGSCSFFGIFSLGTLFKSIYTFRFQLSKYRNRMCLYMLLRILFRTNRL